jgi:hypothetical protein
MKSGEIHDSLLEAEGGDGDESLVEAIVGEESAFDVIERARADAFLETIVGEPVDFRGRSVEESMARVAKLIEKIPMVGTAEDAGVVGFRVDGL